MASTAPFGDTSVEHQGLVGLLRQIPSQISRLVRDEVRAAQAELGAKLKDAGLGAGLLAGAAAIGVFALGVMIATAILGLSTVVAPWLAALIVAVVLLILAVVLVLIGVRKLKNGVPPVPSDSIKSVQADIRAVKGLD